MKYTLISSDTSVSGIPVFNKLSQCVEYLKNKYKGHAILSLDEKILQTCRCIKGNDKTKHPIAYCYESDEVY
jgi:hypothetical protein